MNGIGNRYDGPCVDCGQLVPAGAGVLTPTGPRTLPAYRGGRRVLVRRLELRHAPTRWVGSPVSGHWAGGCPAEVTA